MPISLARKSQRARQMAERQLLEEQAQIINFIINDTADSEDEAECDEDEVQKTLWPVFTTRDTSKPHQGKQKNRSGQPVIYQKPTTHPDQANNKLVPKVVPKQTRHNRKKRAIAATGKNFTMISNWVIQDKPVAAPPSNLDQVDFTKNSSASDVSSDHDTKIDDTPEHTEDEAEETEDKSKMEVESQEKSKIYNNHIDLMVERYRTSKKNKKMMMDAQKLKKI